MPGRHLSASAFADHGVMPNLSSEPVLAVHAAELIVANPP
jgi:hypothetical protein